MPTAASSALPTPRSYVPRHRAAPPPRRGLHTGLVVSGAAVCASGVAVSSGLVPIGDGDKAASAERRPHQVSAPLDASEARSAPARVASRIDLSDRDRAMSRSVDRAAVDPVKRRQLDQASGGQVTATEDLTGGDPRTVARALLPTYGFGSDQFSCLDAIYSQESGWNVHADNPSSSAYGIPQALPGSKMASAGSDWADNAATQIRWGLGYIKGRYGTPCSAWGFKQGHGWY